MLSTDGWMVKGVQIGCIVFSKAMCVLYSTSLFIQRFLSKYFCPVHWPTLLRWEYAVSVKSVCPAFVKVFLETPCFCQPRVGFSQSLILLQPVSWHCQCQNIGGHSSPTSPSLPLSSPSWSKIWIVLKHPKSARNTLYHHIWEILNGEKWSRNSWHFSGSPDFLW